MSEAVVRRCSSKQMFLKVSQISQVNFCVEEFFRTPVFIEYLRWLLLVYDRRGMKVELTNFVPMFPVISL